jgi:hypothetical protein
MNASFKARVLAISIIICFCSKTYSLSPTQSSSSVKIAFKDKTLVLDLILGNSKLEEKSFTRPISVAVDENRRIYVADYERKKIAIFSEEGNPVDSIDGTKRSGVKLFGPVSICIDEEGRLFIADIARNARKIICLSKDHKVIDSFSPRIPPHKVFISNGAIVTTTTVSEFNILVYSMSGELLSKYDEVANMEEKDARTKLAIDKSGAFYIARTFIPLVKKLSPDGKELQAFRYEPTIANKKEPIQITVNYRAGKFINSGEENPICHDIVVDSNGFIYLLVARDHDQLGLCSLWRFDPSGNSFEVAEVPFKCGQIHIDKFDNFYFIGWEEFPYVFRCRVERPEKEKDQK